MKLHIHSSELAIVHEILQRFVPDYTVWAFGSRVSGVPKPFSDLDLALEGSTLVPISTRANLTDAFSESDLPWKVDLVDLNASSPEFQAIITANRLLIQTPASINLANRDKPSTS